MRRLTREDEHVAAGNLALFTLTAFWNQTKQHQKEITAAYRGRNDSWLNLPVSSPLNERFTLEPKDLSFIAVRDAPVFQTILLEESRYSLLAFSVKHHRELVLDKVWPVMAAKTPKGGVMPENELKQILGPALVKDLEVTTAAIIRHVDENLVSTEKAFKELRASLRKMFPKQRFLDFRFAP